MLKLFVKILCTPRCHTISLDVFAVLKKIVAEMNFFDNQLTMNHFDGYFLFQLFDVIMQWTQRCPLLPVTNVLRSDVSIVFASVVNMSSLGHCYLS